MKRIALVGILLTLAGAASADPQGGGPGGIPGPAANTSYLDGCAYILTGVAPATGQQLSLQCDSNGKLLVDSGATSAPYVYTSTGFQQVASFSTSTGFTPPTGSTICFIIPEGNSVRFRTDNVAPTATIGQLLAVGQQLSLTANLAGVRFIPTTGNATLDADCYK